MAETTQSLDLRGVRDTAQTRERQPRQPLSPTRLATYAVLLFGAFLAIIPFFWMVSASLMTETEVAAGKWLPATPLFGNYITALERANFMRVDLWDVYRVTDFDAAAHVTNLADTVPFGWRADFNLTLSGYMWNSARMTLITIIGQIVFCVPAAYAFARMQFFGRNFLFAVMLTTLMIPDIVTLIPNYLTVIWIGRFSEALLGPAGAWFNNWPSLTVPFMASAFSIFLLRQFFAQIPLDFWEAARIDGAGHVTFLTRIVVPLSKAPIMTIITFTFIGSWNSLLWPLLLTNSDAWRPVAVGLSRFVSSDAPGDFHLQMAASVLMIVPILILYFFTQKQFTEGIAASGVKG